MSGDRMPKLPEIAGEVDVAWSVYRVRSDRELDEVLAIEAASFSNPWTREMYLRELEDPDVSFVHALRLDNDPDGGAPGGTTVAFCSFWLVLDELHINNLAVHPGHRQRGYGLALLQYVLDFGARRGAGRATLEVRRSNVVALRLYERLGFKTTATRPAYYTNPIEDALILWREGPAVDGPRA
jgi:[ribosomal protein S18]-alanine N-acetyltransferase